MSNSTPSRVSAQRNFTIIPNGVIASGVSDRAFRTYAALRSYVRPGHDTFPKVSTLADMFGLSESYLRRGIAELQEAGLLIVQKRPYANGFRRVNEYYFPDVDDPKAPYLETEAPDLSNLTGPELSAEPCPIQEETSTRRDTSCYVDSAESTRGATTEQAPPRPAPEPKRDKWGVLAEDRKTVRDAIMKTAREKYGTGAYDAAFEYFLTVLAHFYSEDIATYADMKWSIHPSAQTPNGAGKELNTLIATAIRNEGIPAPKPNDN